MKAKHTLVLLAALLGAAPSLAQTPPTVAGKVTKVDTSAGKITLDHGAIPNLDMPAMTMVFKAANPAMLKAVKTGDKVKFTADTVNGQLTVTTIQKSK
jgi:Cu(I)/Ag(I) efflux system protein CusF